MGDAPVLPRSLAANPVLAQWLAFDREGEVRLSSGKVEIGQGILSALAQIAADELDVAFDRIRCVPADTPLSPNEEVTSGSLSVQDSGTALRWVAAEIRSLFLEAAAARLGIRNDQLVIADGIISGPDNLRTSYWELADAVPLDRTATGRVTPKPVAERHLAGRTVMRPEIAERVHGLRPYLHDLAMPGLRHGRVLRAGRSGAKVIAWDDAPVRAAHPGVLVVKDGSFIGVVAETEAGAEAAAALLAKSITWSDGEACPNPSSLHAWLKLQPAVTSTVHEQGAVPDGNGTSISASYIKPFIAHGSIGPSVALALWEDDRLTVTSHTQGIFNLRRDLALVFGLPEENVRVSHAEGAGCYGHNGADDVALDAALLARKAGVPVRVQWSRADELSQAPFGAAMRMDLAATLDETGRIAHWSHDLYSNGHVARPGRATTPALLAAFDLAQPHPRYVAMDPPLAGGGGAQRNSVPFYAFPNMIVRQHRVLATPVRTSSLRSLGAYGNVFAIESFMDELALEAGQDPLAFRLAHLMDQRARDVLERAAAMAQWGRRLEDGLGRGMAAARYKNTGAWCAVVAEVNVEREPRATKLWIAVDVGEAINPDGVINQVEGGAIQSVSWTLKEELRPSPDGDLPRSWDDYPILRFSEVPAVAVEIIDRPHEPPLGAGECAQGPVAAALANAVCAALGVRVRQLPLTRDRIIAAMENA
jgi:CO/xanthine dehydrogenase Mo-binding subunit